MFCFTILFMSICNYICVSVHVSLKASFCLISESWCGLGVGNLCSSVSPFVAFILGMLDALSVPVPTWRGLCLALVLGSAMILQVCSSAWKSLLSGVYVSGYVCLLRRIWEMALLACVFVCLQYFLKDNALRTSKNTQKAFIANCYFFNSTLGFFLSFLNGHAFVISEHVCTIEKTTVENKSCSELRPGITH